MKKAAFAAAIAAALLLAACGQDDVAIPTAEPKAQETVLSSGECFEVKQERSGGDVRYIYTVKDKSGETIENASCANEPRVAIINSSLLGVRFFADGSTFCRYYDVQNGRVSDSYFNAFWDNGKLVAYHDYDGGHRFIVRDIFDADGYYYEKPVDVFSASISVTKCEYDEDNATLNVTYSYNDGRFSESIALPTKSANR